jgi:hypothetical protein
MGRGTSELVPHLFPHWRSLAGLGSRRLPRGHLDPALTPGLLRSRKARSRLPPASRVIAVVAPRAGGCCKQLSHINGHAPERVRPTGARSSSHSRGRSLAPLGSRVFFIGSLPSAYALGYCAREKRARACHPLRGLSRWSRKAPGLVRAVERPRFMRQR